MSGGGSRGGHRALWVLLGAGGLAGAAAVVGYLAWPRLSLSPTSSSLASISEQGVSHLSVSVTQGGRPVAAAISGSSVQAAHPLQPQGTVTVQVSGVAPSWIGWLSGNRLHASLSLRPHNPKLLSPIAVLRPGGHPTVSFDHPVSVLRWSFGGQSHLLRLPSPSATVSLPLSLAPSSSGGVVLLSASPAQWQAFSSPASLDIFASSGNTAAVTPSPSVGQMSPTSALRFTFSRPVSKVFGSKRPSLIVAKANTAVAGKWSSPNRYSLVFRPAPGALWPGQTVKVTLPTAISVAKLGGGTTSTSSLSYSLAQPSVLRLQASLAQLGYLPLNWSPSASSAPLVTSPQGLYATPSGSFAWRWAPPARLAGLWSPGSYNEMTKAAVMEFEHFNGLNSVGRSNPLLWPTLVGALRSGHVNTNGYSWVDVSETLPEHLTLWHNGKVVLSALVNTGIPGLATIPGTYAVYLRYPYQVMKGTNPNGTHYADPVRWVNYFNGSAAIHGFLRASYGFPQSLGCVELPFSTAAQVYPYLHIGSLVTVH